MEMVIYNINGLGIRGFHYYKTVWTPRKGELLVCKLSESGSVEVKKGRTVVGTVPAELKKKQNMLNAGGKMEAKVLKIVPRYGPKGKGEEIPCRYILSGQTPLFRNACNEIKEVIKELRKNDKTISMKIVVKNSKGKRGRAENCADYTDVKKKKTTSSIKHAKDSNKINQGNTGSRNSHTMTTEILYSTGSSADGPSEDEVKIPLCEKDFVGFSQKIGKNWRLLGIALGLSDVLISQIKEDYRNSETQILKMLVKWKAIKADEACVQNFRKAMKECPKVQFNQPDLDNQLLKIEEGFKSKK